MKLYQKIASLLEVIRLNDPKYCGDTDCFDRHSDALADIERNSLPHGSGFDVGCRILLDECNDSKITIQADFHCMDENGYYCGWREYKVIVRPHLAYGMALRVLGRDYNGLKDYIADTFHHILEEEYTA